MFFWRNSNILLKHPQPSIAFQRETSHLFPTETQHLIEIGWWSACFVKPQIFEFTTWMKMSMPWTDHLFSTYAKSSERLAFLITWYAHLRTKLMITNDLLSIYQVFQDSYFSCNLWGDGFCIYKMNLIDWTNFVKVILVPSIMKSPLYFLVQQLCPISQISFSSNFAKER